MEQQQRPVVQHAPSPFRVEDVVLSGDVVCDVVFMGGRCMLTIEGRTGTRYVLVDGGDAAAQIVNATRAQA